MPKFMEIDLLDNLEKIMKKNTQSYQGIFRMTGRSLKKWQPKRMRSL